MRGEKFREASAHASGEVSACVFLVGNHPTSRLRLSRHFLIARRPLLRASLFWTAEPVQEGR
jgi:hypothetical protein